MYISGMSIGLTALDAARAGIAVTGQNIANVSTEGYHRQEVSQATRLPFETSAGFFGRGVQVETVRRVFNEFLDAQVSSNQASISHYSTYMNYVSQLDSLLGDSRLGLNNALSSFFDAVSDVSADADDMNRRSVMMSKAQTLVDRFQTLDTMFATVEAETNAHIRAVVPMINQFAVEIANLNQNIAALQGATGNTPNDLMDRRDELVRRLNEQVAASVSRDANGSYNVFIGGQALVIGSRAMTNLSVIPSTESPGRVEVAVGDVPISSQIGVGGALGGLLSFRNEVLDSARNQLGRLAVATAQVFNEQHRLGLDLNGQLGGDFFAAPVLGSPIASKNNSAGVLGNPAVSLDNIGNLTADNYRLQYDGANWVLSKFPSNEVVPMTSQPSPPATTPGTAGNPFSAGGMRIVVDGVSGMQPGDSWLIQPTRFAAGQIALAITNPSQIAAAQPKLEATAALDTVAQLDFASWTTGQTGFFTLRVGVDAASAVDVEVSLATTDDTVAKIAAKVAAAINGNSVLQAQGISALASPGTTGILSIGNVGGLTTFDGATVAPNGINVQRGIAMVADYSGLAGPLGFTVDSQNISLSRVYALETEFLADLNSQLTGITASLSNGDLVFTRDSGTGAIEVAAVNANASAAGFIASLGLAGGTDDAVTFTVDGHAVTLNGDYGSNAGVALAIQSQLNDPSAAGPGAYTVTWNATTSRYQITNNTLGTNAPAIVATNAMAYLEGWDLPGNLSATNTTGTLLLTADGAMGAKGLYVTAGLDGVNDNLGNFANTGIGIAAVSSNTLRADNDAGIATIQAAKPLVPDLDVFSYTSATENTVARLDLSTWATGEDGSFVLKVGFDAARAQDVSISVANTDTASAVATKIANAINDLGLSGISADASAADGTLQVTSAGLNTVTGLYFTAGEATGTLTDNAIAISAVSGLPRPNEDETSSGALSINLNKDLSLDVFSQAVRTSQVSLAPLTLNTSHTNTLARLSLTGLTAANGDSFTLTLGVPGGGSQALTVNVTAAGAPATAQEIANSIVAAINADATLRGLKISAVVSPDNTVLVAAYGSGLQITAGGGAGITGELGITPVSNNILLSGNTLTGGSLDITDTVGTEVFSQQVDPKVPPVDTGLLNTVTFTVSAVNAGPPVSYDLAVTDSVLGPMPPILGYVSGADISVNGWTTQLNVTGTVLPGDSFEVKSGPVGVSDNRNGNLLAALETRFSMVNDAAGNPSASFTSAYGLLLSDIANRTAEARSKSEAHGILFNQVSEYQQSVSGVNLDEEAANLIRYQQNYAAAAKLIQISGGLFDTLLDAMR